MTTARKWTWNPAWVLMWPVVVVVGTTLAFILPQPGAAIAPLLLFGIPESIALLSGIGKDPRRNSLPPLTYTTRRYVPRWLTYTLFGALVTSVGWVGTAGLPIPVRLAAIGALFAWLVEHFEVTYREMAYPD